MAAKKDGKSLPVQAINFEQNTDYRAIGTQMLQNMEIFKSTVTSEAALNCRKLHFKSEHRVSISGCKIELQLKFQSQLADWFE